MILDIPGAADRRQTPRYERKLNVDIMLDDGNIVSVTTNTISSSGLQITCDTWITNKIEPRGIQNHSVNHKRLKTITELPIQTTDSTNTKQLCAGCRIISVRRISQDEYVLNLAFIDFENDTESVLNEFLDQYKQKTIVINATI